mgnify:CR=1 FL=1
MAYSVAPCCERCNPLHQDYDANAHRHTGPRPHRVLAGQRRPRGASRRDESARARHRSPVSPASARRADRQRRDERLPHIIRRHRPEILTGRLQRLRSTRRPVRDEPLRTTRVSRVRLGPRHPDAARELGTGRVRRRRAPRRAPARQRDAPDTQSIHPCRPRK